MNDARLGWLLAVLTLSAPLSGTVIPGGTVINQTWTPAGNPYVVQGDVTIPAGAFLTIDPGTVVQLALTDSQGSGIDTARVEITVQGTLTVNGTAGSPVTFSAQSGTAANSWYGLVVAAGASSASLTGALIQHANRGVTSAAPGAVLQLAQSTIAASTYGVYLTDGTPTLSGLELRGHAASGLFAAGASAPTVSGSIVRSNTLHGIHVQTQNGTRTVAVTGCTLHANGQAGLRVEASAGASATANLKNSNVTQNGTGVARIAGAGSTTLNTTYSNVWGNGTNFSNTAAGAAVLSSNPLYVSPPTNLRLTSRSPSRFAGDSGGDLGPLPFISDPTPGYHGTQWANATLTLAGSPYTVAGDLTVAPGVTLVLEPGVVLSFATSDLMASGVDPTRGELLVEGVLAAVGTVAQPVTFSSAGAAANSWRGITLRPGASGSTLDRVVVNEANRAIEHLSTGSHTLRHLTLHGSSTGFYASAGTLALDGVASYGHLAEGMEVTGSAGGVIRNAVVRSNTGSGLIYRANGGVPTQLSVVNATLHANGQNGIMVEGTPGSAATLAVRNAIVTQNLVGIFRSLSGSSPTATVTSSDVWNNITNYLNAVAGTGSISANPLYTSAPTDLTLQPSSVCVDAGDPTGAPDRDFDGRFRPVDGNGIGGAQWDVGAYELIPASGPVTVSIGDANVLEGDVAPVDLVFGVTLSAPTANEVGLSWSTTATGTAAPGLDFTASGGALAFVPGQTALAVAVPVLGDLTDEDDESVDVVLSGPTGATLGDGSGSGLILDGDPMPALSSSDVSLCEGGIARVPLLLDAPSGLGVTVDFQTVAGTAQAGSDFVASNGTAAVPLDASSGTIGIPTLADLVAEPDETFTVTLQSPVNALLMTSQVTVTLIDRASAVCLVFEDGFEGGGLPGPWSARFP